MSTGRVRRKEFTGREPIHHDRAADENIVVRRSTRRLVTALEPLREACAGVWVAHVAGTADRDIQRRRDGLDVPPASPICRKARRTIARRVEDVLLV